MFCVLHFMSQLNYDIFAELSLTVLFCFSFFFFKLFLLCCDPLADGSMLLRDSDHEGVKQMKLVLGSTPPRCVNKCLSCKPCSAALVTSPHHRKEFQASFQRDESYYLLSWKCKCKGKYFQPWKLWPKYKKPRKFIA